MTGVQSHHHVLHIQGGDGHTVHYISKRLNGGSGKFYITDKSKKKISRLKQQYSQNQQVTFKYSSQDQLNIRDVKFDRVLAVNPMKYWRTINQAVQMLLKIMTKRALLVTCFSEKCLLRESKRKGSNWSLDMYVAVLKVEGFELISTENNSVTDTLQEYVLVYAFAPYQRYKVK